MKRSGDNSFVFKLKNLAFNEYFVIHPRVRRSKVVLFEVCGHAKDLDRDRFLGIILLFSDNPIIHSYTFFTALSYSDPREIRKRNPKLLYENNKIRFYRVGVGTFDYFLGYKDRKLIHDDTNQSDGALYLEMLSKWQDGM